MDIDPSAVADRVRAIRRGQRLNQKLFAEKLGIGSGTLARYELGESVPSVEIIGRLHEIFDVDPMWLISGEHSIPEARQYVTKEGSAPYLATNTKDNGGLFYIPQLDLSFSAGHGAYPDDHVLAIDSRPFSREWLKRRGLKAKSLALTRVRGDSMEPILRDKDLVMLDQSIKEPVTGLPIAFRLDSELYIKMCQSKGDGRLEMISANKMYDPIYIDKENPPTDFDIIAAVVWHAHSWV